MRNRNHRPLFDRLDARLVLDSGLMMVAGGNLGSSVLPIVNNGGTDAPDPISDIGWYLNGSPPPVASDPTEIAVPWSTLTTATTN